MFSVAFATIKQLQTPTGFWWQNYYSLDLKLKYENHEQQQS